jgi:UDP-N-acetylglucosamine 2-epimerase (non-hydrolysing)
LHRPATVDEPAILSNVVSALTQIAAELPVLFPVHPSTRARLEGTTLPQSLRLTEPLGYLEFIALEADARVVLTDSGGVQEETTVLGVPCLTLRDNTERPITIDQGTNQLVGRDPARIIRAAHQVIQHGVTPRKPDLWDGRAGERIARALMP